MVIPREFRPELRESLHYHYHCHSHYHYHYPMMIFFLFFFLGEGGEGGSGAWRRGDPPPPPFTGGSLHPTPKVSTIRTTSLPRQPRQLVVQSRKRRAILFTNYTIVLSSGNYSCPNVRSSCHTPCPIGRLSE